MSRYFSVPDLSISTLLNRPAFISMRTIISLRTTAPQLLAVAFWPALALADQTNSEQVIVSATRFEQTTAVNIPANILVIDAAAIEHSGAKTLTELLRSRGGIQVQDVVGSSGRGTTLVMRGFGSNAANNTLVLLDGQKLNNPSLAAPDLSSISMADIERVEIIQGSAGVLFGDQATGGVINIITKRPQQRSVNLEVGRGTEDWESYRGNVSEAFDNGLAYRLSAEKHLSDNYRDNNESGYDNILGNISYTAASFRVFGEAQQINDNMNLPGSLSPAQIAQDRRQTTHPDDFTNIDTNRHRIGTEIALNKNWKLAAEYSYRDADSTGIFFGTQFTDATRVKEFTPRAIGNFDTPFGLSTLTFGYDAQNSDYQSTLTFNKIEQDIDDVYGQLVLPVYTDVTATVGARRSKLDEKNRVTDASNSDSKTVSSFGLSWQMDSNARIFVRRDSSFRWANADENGYTLPGVTFLKPQTSDSNELGFNWHAAAIDASVVLYRLDTENELLFDPAQNFGFGANINLSKSRRDGVNADLNWAINEAVTVRSSVGYVDAETRAGSFKGSAVPFAAKYTGNFGIEWQLSAMFDIYADAQYTGQRYRSGDDPNILGQLGGYTIYNANLRWHVEHWYATLRINNVTAKQYNGFSGAFISSFGNSEYAYPAAERQTYLTVGYKF
ncbi:MAG: hypothetical protein JWM78_262 [Verrucomicrobiaceae bacterium]|nr:hypothetical protein [Verrucomicrobiaceae bacterium]